MKTLVGYAFLCLAVIGCGDDDDVAIDGGGADGSSGFDASADAAIDGGVADSRSGFDASADVASDGGPAITFTPTEWTITVDAVSPGIHRIFMIADVSPLAGDDV